MKFDIVTIFPKMVEGPLAEGIVSRGIASGLLDVKVHDLRAFTTDGTGSSTICRSGAVPEW